MTASNTTEKILVIKLGALGDFIQALGPMQAIRKHHKNAHITLLTTKPFENFARECGYFDDIWIDEKPRAINIAGWLNLRTKLNKGKFTRVYDLQNNDRTSFYFSLFWPKPEWSGVAKGGSHSNHSKTRTVGHAFDGHVETLALAGVYSVEIDRLNWLKSDISTLKPDDTYALLVPGCAPQHPYKRWPAEKYAELAQKLAAKGIIPVILGTKDEADAAETIEKACKNAVNLNGKTSLAQIVGLAREAKFTIGNDTGPMHLIAATGCPCVALFSGKSNRVRHAPKGENVTVLQENSLENLSVETVFSALKF